MSTELKTPIVKSIIGRVEHGNSNLGTATYSSSAMTINSGKGPMIEIALSDPSIQLTKSQVKELIATLVEWL